MPFEKTTHSNLPDGPHWQIRLWPYRSLSPTGFVTFIGATCLMLLLPLLAVLGTPILWGLLPFVIGAVALIWFSLRRSYADANLSEVLSLWPDRIELKRTNPRGPNQTWRVNPYWIVLRIHHTGGPVENYITLTGAGREVEVGVFLSPDERRTLHALISAELSRVKPVPPGN